MARGAHPLPADAAVTAVREPAETDEREEDRTHNPTAGRLGEFLPTIPLIAAMGTSKKGGIHRPIDERGSL
jgi:hypothetical protein